MWSPWGDFEGCLVSCGGAVERRIRSCLFGSVGDVGCVGSIQENRLCNTQVKALNITLIIQIKVGFDTV